MEIHHDQDAHMNPEAQRVRNLYYGKESLCGQDGECQEDRSGIRTEDTALVGHSRDRNLSAAEKYL